MSDSLNPLPRPVSRRAALGFIAACATGLLAACSGNNQSAPAGAKPTEAAKTGGAAAPTTAPAAAPAGKPTEGQAAGGSTTYPADYNDIIEASKKEGGRINAYSIMSKANWTP